MCVLHRAMRSWVLSQHQYICQWYWSPRQAETGLCLCPDRPCLCLCVSLISYTEQYMEYDPFVTTPELSNPWISDDPSLWDLDARYWSRNPGLSTVVEHRKASLHHLVTGVRHCWTAVAKVKYTHAASLSFSSGTKVMLNVTSPLSHSLCLS